MFVGQGKWHFGKRKRYHNDSLFLVSVSLLHFQKKEIRLNCYNEVIRGEDFSTQGDVLLMEPGSVPWFWFMASSDLPAPSSVPLLSAVQMLFLYKSYIVDIELRKRRQLRRQEKATENSFSVLFLMLATWFCLHTVSMRLPPMVAHAAMCNLTYSDWCDHKGRSWTRMLGLIQPRMSGQCHKRTFQEIQNLKKMIERRTIGLTKQWITATASQPKDIRNTLI